MLNCAVTVDLQCNEGWHCRWPWVMFEGHFMYICVCVSKIYSISCTKSITTAGRHMWEIISTV